jgi:hypothetical protein
VSFLHSRNYEHCPTGNMKVLSTCIYFVVISAHAFLTWGSEFKIEAYHRFPQSLKANAGAGSELKSWLLHYTILFRNYHSSTRSLESVVGIATGYVLDDQGFGVRVQARPRIFSSPSRPDRLWGPPSPLSNGYRGFFPWGWSGRSVKMTTHLQLVPRSRKCGSIRPLPYTPSWRST